MFLAIQLGLSLSMNPFVLSSTLGYVTLLSYWRHTRRDLVFSGVIYIGTLWLTSFGVLLGGYDELIYHPVFEKSLSGVYVVLAVIWGVIGWFHLKAWRGLKTGGTHFSLALPGTVIAGDTKRKFKDHLFLVFICTVAGWLLGVCDARFTQNYYLLILLKRQTESGGIWLALGTYVYYMLAYTVVLIACWSYCLISNFSMPVRMKIDGLALLERIGWGALYWAVGLGVIYYLLRVVQL